MTSRRFRRLMRVSVLARHIAVTAGVSAAVIEYVISHAR
jgi:hypothetical protein